MSAMPAFKVVGLLLLGCCMVMGRPQDLVSYQRGNISLGNGQQLSTELSQYAYRSRGLDEKAIVSLEHKSVGLPDGSAWSAPKGVAGVAEGYYLQTLFKIPVAPTEVVLHGSFFKGEKISLQVATNVMVDRSGAGVQYKRMVIGSGSVTVTSSSKVVTIPVLVNPKANKQLVLEADEVMLYFAKVNNAQVDSVQLVGHINSLSLLSLSLPAATLSVQSPLTLAWATSATEPEASTSGMFGASTNLLYQPDGATWVPAQEQAVNKTAVALNATVAANGKTTSGVVDCKDAVSCVTLHFDQSLSEPQFLLAGKLNLTHPEVYVTFIEEGGAEIPAGKVKLDVSTKGASKMHRLLALDTSTAASTLCYIKGVRLGFMDPAAAVGLDAVAMVGLDLTFKYASFTGDSGDWEDVPRACSSASPGVKTSVELYRQGKVRGWSKELEMVRPQSIRLGTAALNTSKALDTSLLKGTGTVDVDMTTSNSWDLTFPSPLASSAASTTGKPSSWMLLTFKDTFAIERVMVKGFRQNAGGWLTVVGVDSKKGVLRHFGTEQGSVLRSSTFEGFVLSYVMPVHLQPPTSHQLLLVSTPNGGSWEVDEVVVYGWRKQRHQRNNINGSWEAFIAVVVICSVLGALLVFGLVPYLLYRYVVKPRREKAATAAALAVGPLPAAEAADAGAKAADPPAAAVAAPAAGGQVEMSAGILKHADSVVSNESSAPV